MRKIFQYFLLFVISGWSADASEIRLRGAVNCTEPVVRLADVAEIDAPSAAELARLPLFPAPANGNRRVATRQEIQQLLLLAEVNLRECPLVGADLVVIQSGEVKPEKTLVRPAYQIVPSRTNVVREAAAEKPPVKPATPAPIAKPEKLVQRGQGITVRSIAPGVRITSPGKALADGALGDELTIELAESRQQVQARVVGPQLVEIRSGASK